MAVGKLCYGTHWSCVLLVGEFMLNFTTSQMNRQCVNTKCEIFGTFVWITLYYWWFCLWLIWATQYNNTLDGPVPQELQNPSGCHWRCPVISCILISPNCCNSNKYIFSSYKSFPFQQCATVDEKKTEYAWKHVTQKVTKLKKKNLNFFMLKRKTSFAGCWVSDWWVMEPIQSVSIQVNSKANDSRWIFIVLCDNGYFI